LENPLARDRRENARLSKARAPDRFDSVHAFLLVGENADNLHRIAHAASADSRRSACLSHRSPSFSSVIETIGRNLVNRLNNIRNQAKLAAVILISVTLGMYRPHCEGMKLFASDPAMITNRSSHIPTLTNSDRTQSSFRL